MLRLNHAPLLFLKSFSCHLLLSVFSKQLICFGSTEYLNENLQLCLTETNRACWCTKLLLIPCENKHIPLPFFGSCRCKVALASSPCTETQTTDTHSSARPLSHTEHSHSCLKPASENLLPRRQSFDCQMGHPIWDCLELWSSILPMTIFNNFSF